jgi:hypothetical protein
MRKMHIFTSKESSIKVTLKAWHAYESDLPSGRKKDLICFVIQWVPLNGIMVNLIMVKGITVNQITVNQIIVKGIMVNQIMVNGFISLIGSNWPRLNKSQLSLDSILYIRNI